MMYSTLRQLMMLVAGSLCITALLFSGLFFSSPSIVPWVVLVFLMQTMVFFISLPQKIGMIFFFSFILSFVSALSMAHVLFSFMFGACISEILFRRIFRNHAPLPDTLSITCGAIGVGGALFVSWGVLQILYTASYDLSGGGLFLMGAVSLVCALALLGALILISNYSKYGSLV